MGTYYDRTSTALLDGTSAFQNEEDRNSEREVAKLIERAFACSIHPFGALAPIDWYAERNGRMIGLLELKTRSHPRGKYPTVFLNVRKWLALSIGSVGLGVPAIFIVRFTDAVCWCPINAIDATMHRVAGCSRTVKSQNDIEPVIEVSCNKLKVIPEN